MTSPLPPEQTSRRDVYVLGAWGELMSCTLDEERLGLDQVRPGVTKMLEHVYEAGYRDAQRDIKRAIGFSA